MNAPPSCRTCVKFRTCMEALRYYPCVDYKRVKVNEKKRNDGITTDFKNHIRPANMDS